MNIPNVLTCSRIVLTVFIIWLLLQGTGTGYVLATVLFIAASITDFYDGYFAKRMGLITDWGKIMDPIADKVLMISVFAALAHTGLVAWWMTGLIVAREVLVTAVRLNDLSRGIVSAAEKTGKIKTVVQMVSIGLCLLYLISHSWSASTGLNAQVKAGWRTLIDVFMMASVILTLYSGAEYFKHRGRR